MAPRPSAFPRATAASAVAASLASIVQHSDRGFERVGMSKFTSCCAIHSVRLALRLSDAQVEQRHGHVLEGLFQRRQLQTQL